MWTPLCLLALASTRVSSQTGYGPFSYPTGNITKDEADGAFFTFGAVNTTHMYINLVVRGFHWFGFGFAQSHYPDSCSPTSGCSVTLTDVGCTGTATTGCRMSGTDAIIFGDYGGTTLLSVQEYTLGDSTGTALGTLQAAQDLSLPQGVTSQVIGGTSILNSVRVIRPFDPSLYGDRYGYTVTYPFAGDFCWLWALGNTIAVSSSMSHDANRGYQCIDFGGVTQNPTPSPSYGPTPGPTADPTPRPSMPPSVAGDTGFPSISPTKNPTPSPTAPTKAPTDDPTPRPTPGPTVQIGSPTKSPTLRPTPSPSEPPTIDPTMKPTPPEGQTRTPTTDPTTNPTTPAPTPEPTPVPTENPTFRREISGPTEPDSSWIEQNLMLILILGVITVLVCFCGAFGCFLWKQNQRTKERREKRQNMLEAEKFKQEQGLNIDAEQQANQNRAANQRIVAANKQKKKRRATGEEDEEDEVDTEPAAAYTAPLVDEDEDEESEPAAAAATVGRGKKTKYEDEEDEEEEEEEKKPKRRAKRKPPARGRGRGRGRAGRGRGGRGRGGASAAAKKSKFKKESSSEESSSSSSESESEEKPARRAKAKARPQRKAKKPEPESEDESESEESSD